MFEIAFGIFLGFMMIRFWPLVIALGFFAVCIFVCVCVLVLLFVVGAYFLNKPDFAIDMAIKVSVLAALFMFTAYPLLILKNVRQKWPDLRPNEEWKIIRAFLKYKLWKRR